MDTIVELFELSCEKFLNNPYLWEKREGKYASTTYGEVKSKAIEFAGALLSLGLNKGDRVALLSEGCNKWIYTELGMLYAGGVNVPLSIKLSDSEILFRIEHSGARFLVVSHYYYQRIHALEGQLTGIEKIIVFDREKCEERVQSFEILLSEGRVWLEKHRPEFEERVRSIRADDLVNISYTSGTTTEPKGIMLSHKNYVTNVLQADSLIRIPSDYRVLLFLPWDHSFAHTVGIYSFMYNGASLASVDFGLSPMEYLRNIPINLREIRPHVLLSVPALAKNFRKNIETAIRAKGWFTKKLYQWGLNWGYRYNGFGDDRGKGMRWLLWPLVCIADRAIFSKIRRFFGGNLQFFVGGGALLDIDLQQYYAALGIPMLQGYGLTEASPVISTNTPDCYHFGSSGMVVKPLDVKICDEEGKELSVGQQGEIWIRGGNVMAGYWRNEKSTRETIVDGWLHTGDIGYFRSEGWLYVLGRYKSLLIANDGEKYSPEGIEESIVEHSRFIENCILYNNQSPYTVGLIVPNKLALEEYIRRQNVEPKSMDAYRLMALKLEKELLVFRKGGNLANLYPERWLPAVIGILPEVLGEKNGLVNSTMKVVRRKVIDYYQAEIDYLYTPEGKAITNGPNLRNLKQIMS